MLYGQTARQSNTMSGLTASLLPVDGMFAYGISAGEYSPLDEVVGVGEEEGGGDLML